MGQVQTSEEEDAADAHGPDTAMSAVRAGEGAPEAAAPVERTPVTPSEVLIGHRDDRSPPEEAPSKDTVPPPVELGDIAVKERRANRQSREFEAELTPTAPDIRQTSQKRTTGSRSERRSRSRNRAWGAASSSSSTTAQTDRAATPARRAPLGSPHQGPADPPAAQGGWSPEHQSPGVAPRHTVVAGGSRTLAAACAMFIAGCVVGVVGVLVYGTVKNMGHQRRVIDDIRNFTLFRLKGARNGSDAGNSSDATLADVLHGGNLTQGAANVTLSTMQPPRK